MDVRMKQEILAPGMQDREESVLGAKMFGLGGHLHKRLRNGAEQQVVVFDGILTDQRVEQVGQRKYDVKVASRQQFVLPSSDPSLTGLSLALGTMAVTTTNGDLSISCRNRHCPKCQTNARQKWLRRRQQELLPAVYYHLVFSVPHAL